MFIGNEWVHSAVYCDALKYLVPGSNVVAGIWSLNTWIVEKRSSNSFAPWENKQYFCHELWVPWVTPMSAPALPEMLPVCSLMNNTHTSSRFSMERFSDSQELVTWSLAKFFIYKSAAFFQVLSSRGTWVVVWRSHLTLTAWYPAKLFAWLRYVDCHFWVEHGSHRCELPTSMASTIVIIPQW